jgi:arylsulfatase A-like enzyme
MREPTVFWWPGKMKPAVQMEMGTTMDLLPTFCSLAGAKAPADRTLDGYDLSGLLLGKLGKGPRNSVQYWREEKLYAIRVGPWKAHFITQGCYGIGEKKTVHATPQLYHLENDPSEKYNVAANHPDVVKTLVAAAEKHRKSIKPVADQLIRR